MHRIPRRLVLLVACLAAGAAVAQPAAAGGAAEPVPSLEPRETEALWQRLVRQRTFRPLAAGADCRPARVVFYAANDWLRLATRLAAQASPCAQYYVSVPPLVADKTRPRPGQASRIRALGPSFHALAEIHLTAWQKWVASTGSSWYEAGVEARRRMAAAGYDVAAGDTWAVNELSSAVRRGDGARRAEAREFLRGLFDAAGEGPATRGVAFVVGVGQRSNDTATYKARLQEWLQDSTFWVDMNAYVSDWSQEVYADVRGYAAPGTPTASRRDALVDYLLHPDLLALAGGAASGTANAFLGNAGSPLGNAAWQWGSAFGWTLVPADLMRHFVSAQVYAMRSFASSVGRPLDRFGFAWAPRNADALLGSDFTRQSGAVLDRLAAAIRDSGVVTPSDPGVGACNGGGCGGELEGATLTEKWRGFRAWSPTTLGFTSAPQAVGAGAVSAPISLQAQVAGVAARPVAAVAAMLSSSSPTGGFATTPAGPFTPTITVTLPAGAFATAQVFYLDQTSGSVTLTASASGVVTGTQQLTVTGAPPVALRVEPSSSTLLPGATATFTAVGVDEFGNETPTAATWTVTPESLGTVAPAAGSTTTFTAGAVAGSGQVVATVTSATGTLAAAAAVTVEPPPPVRVAAVRYGVAKRQLHVYVTVVDERGRRVRDASVTVALYRNGKLYARASGRTTAGRMTFARPASWGTYRTKVTRVATPTRSWVRKTPPNVFRKPLRRAR